MRKIITALLLLITVQQSALSQPKRPLPNGETFFSYTRKDPVIDKITVLPPITSIYEINTRDIMEYDSTLSVSTAQLAGRVLRSSLPDSLHKAYLPLDYNRFPQVAGTLIAICNSTSKKKQARDLILPDSFLKHFDTAQTRYVLCFLHSGFVRTENNFQKQGVRKMIFSFISLGNVLVIPIKNKSSAYCCIFDLKNRNMVYFAHARHEKSNASEESTIRYMVNHLVKHYFM